MMAMENKSEAENHEALTIFVHRGTTVYFDSFRRILRLGDTRGVDHWNDKTVASPLELEFTASGKNAPSFFTLMLSSHCNLACSYCCEFHGSSSRFRPLMSVETIRHTLDWVFHFENEGQLSIVLLGGEPLLNPQGVREAVSYAKTLAARQGRACDLQMTSNLTLMTEDIARFLTDHEVLIQISLDGPQLIHDRYRIFANGRGTHRLVMQGLEILARYQSLRDIHVYATLTDQSSAIEVLDYLLGLGFRKISLVPCNGSDVQEMSPEKRGREFDLLLEHSLPLFRKDPDVRIFPVTNGLTRLYQFLGLNKKKHGMDCGAATKLVAISAEGNIFPCHETATDKDSSRWVIGNIKTGWDSGRLKAFRDQTSMYRENCVSCWSHPLCGGVCKLQLLAKGVKSGCIIRSTYKSEFWRSCLFWYAALRDRDPALLLRIVDPPSETVNPGWAWNDLDDHGRIMIQNS